MTLSQDLPRRRPAWSGFPAAVVAGLALAACTATGATEGDTAEATTPDPRRGEEVDRICFASNINGFTETTRRSVVVEVGANTSYLIETFGPCFNLDRALSLGVSSTTSCLTRGDNLYASDSVFGFNDRTGIPPQRCVVNKMYRWNPDARAEDADSDPASGAAPDETPPEETGGADMR